MVSRMLRTKAKLLVIKFVLFPKKSNNLLQISFSKSLLKIESKEIGR